MNLTPLPAASSVLQQVLADARTGILFLTDPRVRVDPVPGMFERFASVMDDTGAAIVYSDASGHPRIPYQCGSIRDSFDFGPVVAVSVKTARAAYEHEPADVWKWGSFFDLRLRLAAAGYPIVRIPEPLYAATVDDLRPTGEKQFDYVDPRNRDYQIEMEQIATAHLKRIGASLEPVFRSVPAALNDFPIQASVVIPVRNRERTIKDAVESALSQHTDFAFNVIVVDNHSTDATGDILRAIKDKRLVHRIPLRGDLGIGGCWNEAIQSPLCGRYAIQLDSDDLYRDSESLQRMVDALAHPGCAMVVGAYTMVNFALQEIPPGLIDHREWTRDNGRNNALRVNGFGAPRGFDVSVLRGIGFPNVSYGEDYAVGLRVSREYEIGRIYDSVYLCRRWEGNSDSALPLDVANRYDYYKDWLRSNEIQARQEWNRQQ